MPDDRSNGRRRDSWPIDVPAVADLGLPSAGLRDREIDASVLPQGTSVPHDETDAVIDAGGEAVDVVVETGEDAARVILDGGGEAVEVLAAALEGL